MSFRAICRWNLVVFCSGFGGCAGSRIAAPEPPTPGAPPPDGDQRQRPVANVGVAVPTLKVAGIHNERIRAHEAADRRVVHAPAHVDETAIEFRLMSRETDRQIVGSRLSYVRDPVVRISRVAPGPIGHPLDLRPRLVGNESCGSEVIV